MKYALLETTSVSFFGHRYIDRFGSAEEQVMKIISELLTTKPYVEFLVGRDGDFDQLVSSCIRKAKSKYGDSNCAHTLVLPYMRAEFRDNQESFYEYYDEVELASNVLGNTHYKAAFQKRNRYMVDRSDLVVVYIDHESGGAYQTYQYALKQGKKVINIVDLID